MSAYSSSISARKACCVESNAINTVSPSTTIPPSPPFYLFTKGDASFADFSKPP
jgi:hypothetical protein